MSQVITTVLLGDDPNSVKVIQLEGRTGTVFLIPRPFLATICDRQDLHQPGVYFLFGEGMDKPRVYIGQSEDCFGRLTDHDRKREETEWNEALVFTGGLHATYVRYLESIAIRQATSAGRYEVTNRIAPPENNINEAGLVISTRYFENMKFTTAFLGYRLFETLPTKETASDVYTFTQGGANAKGTLLPSGDFVVFTGSTARSVATGACPISSRRKREELIESGVLQKQDDGYYVFTQDYNFGSPSGAANVVAGVACNGWEAWKDSTGHTLSENVRS